LLGVQQVGFLGVLHQHVVFGVQLLLLKNTKKKKKKKRKKKKWAEW